MNAPSTRHIVTTSGLGVRDRKGAIDHSAGRNLEFLYGRRDRPGRLPDDWRARLPPPEAYYRQHLHDLSAPNAFGWATAKCPFHDDKHASLSVQLTDARGGWRCQATCSGGDLLGFHQRRTGLPFVEAVRDLLGAVRE
jgi:hypothetical protein